VFKITSLAVAAAVALGVLSSTPVRAAEEDYSDYKEPLGVLIEKKSDRYGKKEHECRFYPDDKDFYDKAKREDPYKFHKAAYFQVKDLHKLTILKCDFYLKYPPKYVEIEKKFKCLIVAKYYDYYKPKDKTEYSLWVADTYGKAKLTCLFKDDYDYDRY
jgi:hypothetical protein